MTGRDHEAERLYRLGDYSEDETEGWQAGFRPGTFGCHELLAHLWMITESFRTPVLDHPALFLNPQWYAIASEAFDRLHELREEIAAIHLGDGTEPNELAARLNDPDQGHAK